MSKSLDLKVLINVFKKVWWKVIICTVIVATATGLFAKFFIPNKYTSAVEFMVNNDDSNTEYITASLTTASEALAKDYSRIITSDKMVELIREYISNPNRDKSGTYANITDAQIRNTINATTPTDGSSVFSISVTTESDSHLAYYIAECISVKAPGVIQEVKDSEKTLVTVLRDPIHTNAPSSPGIFTYVSVSAVFAAVLVYAIFVIVGLFDNAIVTEEDIKEKLNKPVVGEIPRWFISASTQKEEN